MLDFVKYELSDSKQTPVECLYEGSSYTASLHVTFRLKDGDEFREEKVYMGEVPLMTADGAFVVNGAERVVVSQLHRSPGICSESALHPNGSTIFSMRIIPWNCRPEVIGLPHPIIRMARCSIPARMP